MANLEIYNFDHVVNFPILEPLSITFLLKQLLNIIVGSTTRPCQRFAPICKKKKSIEDLPNAKVLLFDFFPLASTNGTHFENGNIWLDFA